MGEIIKEFYRKLAIGRLWAASACVINRDVMLDQAAQAMVEWYVA